MAALVGSRLTSTLANALIAHLDVFLWSDSSLVLHWLKSESLSLKPFVGIGVAEIQSTWPSSNWHYVPSPLNVADDLSRCLSVDELDKRWFFFERAIPLMASGATYNYSG